MYDSIYIIIIKLTASFNFWSLAIYYIIIVSNKV